VIQVQITSDGRVTAVRDGEQIAESADVLQLNTWIRIDVLVAQHSGESRILLRTRDLT
jgi:hypothetical protein